MTVHTLPLSRPVLPEKDRRHILTMWAARMPTDVIASLAGFTEAEVYNVIARSKGRTEQGVRHG